MFKYFSEVLKHHYITINKHVTVQSNRNKNISISFTGEMFEQMDMVNFFFAESYFQQIFKKIIILMFVYHL